MHLLHIRCKLAPINDYLNPQNDVLQGRLQKEGNGARCTMAKSGGGDFLLIMMLLL